MAVSTSTILRYDIAALLDLSALAARHDTTFEAIPLAHLLLTFARDGSLISQNVDLDAWNSELVDLVLRHVGLDAYRAALPLLGTAARKIEFTAAEQCAERIGVLRCDQNPHGFLRIRHKISFPGV